MTDLLSMEGKVIIVTGGASGIGKGAVEIAVRRGGKVVIADLNEALGTQVVQSITKAGGSASFIRTDVTCEEDVRNMVRFTVDTYGGLDCAFNNAGVAPTSKLLHEVTRAEWDRAIAINLTGVWLCMKYEIEEMLTRGKGAILNTSSAAGLRGNRGFSEYIAGKHGVVGLGRAAGVEYGVHGIRVNTLIPGAVETPMLQGAMDIGLNAFSAAKYPIPRAGRIDELGEAAMFLLSDAASYITGAYLAVDGGTTAT